MKIEIQNKVFRAPLHIVPLSVALNSILFPDHEATELPWPAHLSTGLVEVSTTAEPDSDSEGGFLFGTFLEN